MTDEQIQTTVFPPSREGLAYKPQAKSQTHLTPMLIVEPLHLFLGGPPDLDPCGAPFGDLVGAPRRFVLPESDGLKEDWGTGTVYCNPPYDVDPMAEFTVRCRRHGRRIACTVALLPAHKSESIMFQRDVLMGAAQVCFLAQRLRYHNDHHSAPFPSMVVYWGKRVSEFEDHFGHLGGMMRK